MFPMQQTQCQARSLCYNSTFTLCNSRRVSRVRWATAATSAADFVRRGHTEAVTEAMAFISLFISSKKGYYGPHIGQWFSNFYFIKIAIIFSKFETSNILKNSKTWFTEWKPHVFSTTTINKHIKKIFSIAIYFH